MNKLEEVVGLLHNIEVDSNGYRLGDDMEYEITWTKNLPTKIARVSKTSSVCGWLEYKVYFRNKVDWKRLNDVCKDQKYRSRQTTQRFEIGYNGEIFAEESFISFIPKYKKKALDIIDAYLKSK